MVAGPRQRTASYLAAVAVLVCGCSESSTGGHPATQTTSLGTTTTNAPVAPASVPASDELTTKQPSANDARAADDIARSAFVDLGNRAPALYVGIWDPQRGYFVKAYGQAVRGGAQATIADSFRIASITKTFTATVVLQLIAAGKIRGTATVATYLPTLAASNPALQKVTIEQLLDMRSGLPDYLNDPNGIAKDIQADPQRVWQPAELVTRAIRLGPADAGTPGYSNTNYVLLGLVAETVSGQPLASLIAHQLTQPLQLAHTRLPSSTDTALPAPAAHGYLNADCVEKAAEAGAHGIDPNTDTTMWNTSYFQGAGGMYSTLGDLGRWAATDLGTDLLPASLARARLAVRDIGGDGFPYGLGIKRFGAWYGHDGDAFGWDTLAVHDPSTGVTFVAAANACTGLTGDFLQLLQRLYPDQPTS